MNDIDMTLIDDTEPETKSEEFIPHDELCDCSECLRENMHYYFAGGL